MIRVTSTEFGREPGHYQDVAMSEPVIVTSGGLDQTVMISVKEYKRLKRRDREVLGLEDFTDADIAALENSRPPVEAAAFDNELEP